MLVIVEDRMRCVCTVFKPGKFRLKMDEVIKQ